MMSMCYFCVNICVFIFCYITERFFLKYTLVLERQSGVRRHEVSGGGGMRECGVSVCPIIIVV